MKIISGNHMKDDGLFEKRFNEVFCNESMHTLLEEKVGSSELWRLCMSYMRGTSELRLTEINPVIFTPKGKVNYLIKFLSNIRPSLESWFDPRYKATRCKDLDILFISRNRIVKIRDGDTIYNSDYLFHSIIQEFVTNYPHVKLALLCDTDLPQNINVAGHNIYRFIRPWDFIKSLILPLKKIIQWKIVQNSNTTLRKKEFKPDWPDLDVNSFFSLQILFFNFLRDYAYLNAINTLNPKIIVANDDMMQLKPISDSPDLRFIALQSASVFPTNEVFRRFFIREFGSDSVKSDYFICSGEYYKELKEYSNVSKNVVVMGQPRYDILVHADITYNKNQIIQDLNLDPRKKIVFWCTQTHGQSLDESVMSISAVYDAMASILDEAQLVIKLHPDEDQNARLYHENKLYKPVILEGNTDIYALLFVCDLMITKDSTTAMEAVILDKPVIVLNFSGSPDRVNYVREGVAFGVYDPADLSPAIKKLLTDGSVSHEKRQQFIERYLYRVDGKATERIVDLIKSLLDAPKS